MPSVTDLRRAARRTAVCSVSVAWKSESGEKYSEKCRAIDLSESGVALESSHSIPIGYNVVFWARDFHVAALAQVRHCTWRSSIYIVGLSFLAKTSTAGGGAAEGYEILTLGPDADFDSVDRVYRNLAKRYHPDNKETGDSEAFLRLREAYHVLADPSRRPPEEPECRTVAPTPRYDPHSEEFVSGVKAARTRRDSVLCALYRRRSLACESPGVGLPDLEQITGFTREELGFALWYLADRGMVQVTDSVQYRLTAQGVDLIEEKIAVMHAA